MKHSNFCKKFFSWFYRKDKILMLIIFAGIGIRIFYLSYTDYNVRSHDADGHIDYIKYVAEKFEIPRGEQCWECHQMPLYYLFAGFFYKFFQMFGVTQLNFVLQCLSLAFFAVFLFFGVKTLKLIIKEKTYLRVATLILFFWPGGIINSIRISNDSLFYALWATGFYFLVNWIKEGKQKNFYIASVVVLLSLFAKTSGLILVVLAGVALLLKVLLEINEKKKFFPKIFSSAISHKKEIIMFFLITTLGLSAISYKNFFYFEKIGETAQSRSFFERTVKNDSLSGALKVGNNISNYLRFDVEMFNKKGFTSPWVDGGGRQYFWNYLLKTSLFGEFDTDSYDKKGSPWPWATYINGLALVLFFTVIFGVVFLFFKNIFYLFKGNGSIVLPLFILSSSLIPLVVLIFYRIRAPYACNNDFRFILPIMIPLPFIYVEWLKFWDGKWTPIKNLCISLIILMAISSLMFFISISGLFQIL